MCWHWVRKGCCAHGDVCKFAHGEAQLRDEVAGGDVVHEVSANNTNYVNTELGYVMTPAPVSRVFVGADGIGAGAIVAGNIMKPELSRGDLLGGISATTIEEYCNFLEKSKVSANNTSRFNTELGCLMTPAPASRAATRAALGPVRLPAAAAVAPSGYPAIRPEEVARNRYLNIKLELEQMRLWSPPGAPDSCMVLDGPPTPPGLVRPFSSAATSPDSCKVPLPLSLLGRPQRAVVVARGRPSFSL